MHKPQKQVEEFHRALEVTVGESPAIRDAPLRASLILEEAVETIFAILGSRQAVKVLDMKARQMHRGQQIIDPDCTEPDLVEAIDGLCDLLVVTYGTAVEFGIDLEPFFDEVNRTNMAKVGGPVREDGKRLKPPGWKPPRIREMLDELIRKERIE